MSMRYISKAYVLVPTFWCLLYLVAHFLRRGLIHVKMLRVGVDEHRPTGSSFLLNLERVSCWGRGGRCLHQHRDTQN